MKNLGKEATDKVTGFTGTIIGKCFYLFGCAQYGVVPKVDKDGKAGEAQWFDEGRVEIVGNGILPEDVKSEINGGPQSDGPRGRY